MSSINISLGRTAGVANLQLRTRYMHNGLDEHTLIEIANAVRELADISSIRGLIVSSAVDRVFSVGVDLDTLTSLNAAQRRSLCQAGQDLINAIEAAPYCTIAAVDGPALGGGWELALACDLVYASERAVFAFPEVALGVIPAFGGLWRLAEIVGPMRAKELVMTSRGATAAAAKAMGFVLEVMPAIQLIPFCESTAERIATKDGNSVTHVKNSTRLQSRAGWNIASALDADAFVESDSSVIRTRATLRPRKSSKEPPA